MKKHKPEVHIMDEPNKIEIFVERVIYNEPATILFYRTPQYIGGRFTHWSETKKVVAKCNLDAGDKYSKLKGFDVAMLKAYRKLIDNTLRKY